MKQVAGEKPLHHRCTCRQRTCRGTPDTPSRSQSSEDSEPVPLHRLLASSTAYLLILHANRYNQCSCHVNSKKRNKIIIFEHVKQVANQLWWGRRWPRNSISSRFFQLFRDVLRVQSNRIMVELIYSGLKEINFIVWAEMAASIRYTV